MDTRVTSCECTAHGWCERHRCHKPPHLWRLCRISEPYFAAWERGEGLLQSLFRGVCARRSPDPVDSVECDLCGLRGRQVPVYGCDIHGRCTERRFTTYPHRQGQIVPCATCESFVPVSSPEGETTVGRALLPVPFGQGQGEASREGEAPAEPRGRRPATEVAFLLPTGGG